MVGAQHRMDEILKRIKFHGLMYLLNMNFHTKITENNLILIRGDFITPDRKNPKQIVQLSIIHYVSLFELENLEDIEIVHKIEDWLLKFWRHEFYESFIFDNKHLEEQH